MEKANKEGKAELIAKARQGDWEAFGELVKTCGNRLPNLCKSILKSEEAAKDAIADTLLKAKNSLPGFREEAEFCTWFYTIAVNVCLDECRRRKRQIDADTAALIIELVSDGSQKGIVQTSPGTASFSDAVVERISLQQRKEAVQSKVEQIKNKKQRWDALDFQVYMLHEDEGCTYKKVAERFNEAVPDAKVTEVNLRQRMSTKVQPILDEVDIEAKMQEKAETKWDETDLRMFSARVARGKELRQTRFLFFKGTATYSRQRYQERIAPVLADVVLGRHANNNAAQAKPEDRWNTADTFLFQKFVLEGVDYAEIVALSQKPDAVPVVELGQRTIKKTAVELCRERYHQRIKKIVIDTIKELR